MLKLFGQAWLIALSAGLTLVYIIVITSSATLQFKTPELPDGKGGPKIPPANYTWVCMTSDNFILPNKTAYCTASALLMQTLVFSAIGVGGFWAMILIPNPAMLLFYGWVTVLMFFFKTRTQTAKPMMYLPAWGASLLLGMVFVGGILLIGLWK